MYLISCHCKALIKIKKNEPLNRIKKLLARWLLRLFKCISKILYWDIPLSCHILNAHAKLKPTTNDKRRATFMNGNLFFKFVHTLYLHDGQKRLKIFSKIFISRYLRQWAICLNATYTNITKVLPSEDVTVDSTISISLHLFPLIVN